MDIESPAAVRVADEVWIATALLHREQPDAVDFTLSQIEARLRRESVVGVVRRGVYPHLSAHCVANRPPSPGRYRMLVETAPSRRRLFRPGDAFHPDREGAKTHPRRDEIPRSYHNLLDWYDREYARRQTEDPLLAVARRYRSLWKDTDPDAYVRSLRENW